MTLRFIVVTSDLGRVTTPPRVLVMTVQIVVTSDLGRVTTDHQAYILYFVHCGDVRSRTSYNSTFVGNLTTLNIVVTSDLGRVTTTAAITLAALARIVVTSDLGRVTTLISFHEAKNINCGDVRSRTSYNGAFQFSIYLAKLW